MIRKLSKLFIVFGVIFLSTICVGCDGSNTDVESKIEKMDNINEYLDDVFNNEEVEKSEYWSGIEIWVFCDYSKHEKYDEWMGKYDLKDTYSSSREKYLDDYFVALNSACYELIKDKFTNGEFTSICTGEFLYFTYSNQEKLDKDYKGFEELAEHEYVVRIVVQETDASQFRDD